MEIHFNINKEEFEAMTNDCSKHAVQQIEEKFQAVFGNELELTSLERSTGKDEMTGFTRFIGRLVSKPSKFDVEFTEEKK